MVVEYSPERGLEPWGRELYIFIDFMEDHRGSPGSVVRVQLLMEKLPNPSAARSTSHLHETVGLLYLLDHWNKSSTI
jgi:hypothetical protein